MRRLAFVAFAVLASACANRSTVPGDPAFASSVRGESVGEEEAEPMPPDDPITRAKAARLKVLQTGDLGCPEEAIGVVDVHERMPTEEQALDILRRRAAVLDAEGITGVEFHHGEGGQEVTHLSGMAVRCRDILNGRQYRIIQAIDIAGAMGKEDDAFDALKARARELGANLLLDVTFEHGDAADGKTHVRGTAVRTL